MQELRRSLSLLLSKPAPGQGIQSCLKLRRLQLKSQR
jgi:hypothetical protein